MNSAVSKVANNTFPWKLAGGFIIGLVLVGLFIWYKMTNPVKPTPGSTQDKQNGNIQPAGQFIPDKPDEPTPIVFTHIQKVKLTSDVLFKISEFKLFDAKGTQIKPPNYTISIDRDDTPFNAVDLMDDNQQTAVDFAPTSSANQWIFDIGYNEIISKVELTGSKLKNVIIEALDDKNKVLSSSIIDKDDLYTFNILKITTEREEEIKDVQNQLINAGFEAFTTMTLQYKDTKKKKRIGITEIVFVDDTGKRILNKTLDNDSHNMIRTSSQKYKHHGAWLVDGELNLFETDEKANQSIKVVFKSAMKIKKILIATTDGYADFINDMYISIFLPTGTKKFSLIGTPYQEINAIGSKKITEAEFKKVLKSNQEDPVFKLPPMKLF